METIVEMVAATTVCVNVQLPTIIADNGGYDSADLIAKLRAAHTDSKATHGLGEIIASCRHDLLFVTCIYCLWLVCNCGK